MLHGFNACFASDQSVIPHPGYYLASSFAHHLVLVHSPLQGGLLFRLLVELASRAESPRWPPILQNQQHVYALVGLEDLGVRGAEGDAVAKECLSSTRTSYTQRYGFAQDGLKPSKIGSREIYSW